MIVFFATYILIAFVLACRHPSAFFVFYILASTKFLGFFDPESIFIFGGLGVASPVLNLSTLLTVIFFGNHRSIKGKYKSFTKGIIMLLLYGIISPVVVGYESLFQSIIASKELWSIFFFIYLVMFKEKITIDYMTRVIIKVGLLISLSYVIYFVFNIHAPFYFNDGVFRAFYPTYISLAWFFVCHKKISNEVKMLPFILHSILFVTGMILAGHAALSFSTVLMIIFYFFNLKRQKDLKIKMFFKTIFLLMLGTYMAFAIPSIYNQINAIISREDASIAARDTYNAFRWKAINEKPFFGYGFIHESAGITDYFKDIDNNRFAEKFAVVDSGYVDILIKFGFVGLFFLLCIWLKIVFLVFKKLNIFTPLEVLCSLYILQYFAINYTWSVFTYSHGLIPGFIAIFIITNKIELFKNQQKYAHLR